MFAFTISVSYIIFYRKKLGNIRNRYLAPYSFNNVVSDQVFRLSNFIFRLYSMQRFNSNRYIYFLPRATL